MLNDFDVKDKITALFSKVVNTLLLENPLKTSLGFLLGIFFKGISDIICAVLKVTFSISYPFCIAAGILIAHGRSLFTKHNLDENIETAIHYLNELQKTGNFSEAEKRRQWKKLVELVYRKVNETSVVVSDNSVSDTNHDGPQAAS